jgi:phosphoribosyl 1,2-cyclic phosphodiesterase
MKLIVLGSSSSGNGYILQDDDGNSLILEAGVRLVEVKKALDYDIQGIQGCLITHRHGDHIKFATDYMKAGIDIYTGDDNELKGHRFIPIKEKEQKAIGPFKIKSFPLVHDVQTFGYLIDHPESGKTCFITDTAYCAYTFSGLNNIIIEANYCQDIMTERFLNGSLNAMVRARTMRSHMSFQSTLDFLKANDLKSVNNIVLVHLSSGNADSEKFRTKTIEATGKKTEVAFKGQIIELNKTPFT